MLRKLSIMLAAAALLWVVACEGEVTDGDGDVDADADTDTDIDMDADSDGCPMNSGAPCACDHPNDGECDDGSWCLGITNIGSSDLGVCASRCSCDDYDQACAPSGYGAESRCIIAGAWPIADDTICRCVLFDCDTAEDCPPDQDCRQITGTQGPYAGVELNICFP